MSESLTLIRDSPWEFSQSTLTKNVLPRSPVRGLTLGAETALVGTEKRERDFGDRLRALRDYRRLPANWDKYGGVGADDRSLGFADNLISELQVIPDVPAPLIRPISGGVYLEWRCGDALLYFEADQESVLRYSRNVFGEETVEDADFDSERAVQVVVDFHKNAA